MHFTYFDATVLTVLALSAALSFFRGLVREMLSLATWAGALIITLYAFFPVAKLFEQSIANKTIAGAFAGLLTFLVALIALSMLSRLLLKFTKPGSEIGLLDNGMGLLFGVARGALVVAIGYFIFTLAIPKEADFPEWMQDSVTQPYVKRAAIVVAKIAPSYLDELTKATPHAAKPSAVEKKLEKAAEPLENIPAADIDWPTQDDLKQRMRAIKKEPDAR